MGNFLPPWGLEPGMSHKPSPTPYNLNQASSGSILFLGAFEATQFCSESI